MNNFEIIIASPEDRHNLVAEIWHKNQMIAEINKEKNDFKIEFYLKKKLVLDYDTFCSILKEAKEKLQKM